MMRQDSSSWATDIDAAFDTYKAFNTLKALVDTTISVASNAGNRDIQAVADAMARWNNLKGSQGRKAVTQAFVRWVELTPNGGAYCAILQNDMPVDSLKQI